MPGELERDQLDGAGFKGLQTLPANIYNKIPLQLHYNVTHVVRKLGTALFDYRLFRINPFKLLFAGQRVTFNISCTIIIYFIHIIYMLFNIYCIVNLPMIL